MERELLKPEYHNNETSSSDFVLQWGNRKRLRCMKVQTGSVQKNAAQINRRTIKTETVANIENPSNPTNTNDYFNLGQPSPSPFTITTSGNGYINLRRRTSSPSSHPQRVLRRSWNLGGMRGGQMSGCNGAVKEKSSKIDSNNNNSGGSNSSEQEGNKKGDTWPPKLVIGLTKEEKEEDFMAIKGTKLPLRPKKRPKLVQRTLNLVSPGGWLCDLTLDRYEVREKKTSKKRPRGLKALGNMESESE